MRRTELLLINLLLVVALFFSACSRQRVSTEYTHAIPADVSTVASIQGEELIKKSKIRATSGTQLTGLLGGDVITQEQTLSRLFHAPQEIGIDLNAPCYLFNAPSLHCEVTAIKISDLNRLEAFIDNIESEGLCTSPQKRDGYLITEITDTGVGIAYNNGTLLLINAGSSSELQKLSPAITRLMKQHEQESIHAHPHFRTMMEQKGDIRLLTTPDALPINLRGLFGWPRNTQLSGYLLFENGRVYGTLQKADFDGETHESSQPERPQNSNELQRSMGKMMQGIPYHIELDKEALLTLTNLRALMEFTPDEPTVKQLYQFVTMIEKISVRGDRNRCNLIIMLHEKNRNALEQLTAFAHLFNEM